MCQLCFEMVYSRCDSWFLFWVILAICGSSRKVSGQFVINLHCPDEFVGGSNLVTCKINTTEGKKQGCNFGGLISFQLTIRNQASFTACGQDFIICDQNFNSDGCRCVSDKGLKHYEYNFIADKNIHANAKLDCIVGCFPPKTVSKYITPSCNPLKFHCSKKSSNVLSVSITMKTACEDGSYGQGCLLCGNCSGVDVCNKADGRCPGGCIPGKKPPLCQEECDDGFFGNCQDSCGQCARGQSCDKATGACTSCLPGYKPPLCQECMMKDGCRNDTQETTVSIHPIIKASSDISSTLNIVLISFGIILLIVLGAITLLVRHRLKNPQLESPPSPLSEPIAGDELQPYLAACSEVSEIRSSSPNSSEAATSSIRSSGNETKATSRSKPIRLAK